MSAKNPFNATLCGAGAVTLLAVALLPPLGMLARGTLFSAHMLQHLILLLGVPALGLFALGENRLKRGSGVSPLLLPARPAWSVVAAWLAGAAGMWIWHIPALCNAAASNAAVYLAQTVSLLALGTAYWYPLLGGDRDRRLGPMGSVTYLFTGCLSCTLQGVALTFSPAEVCTAYLSPIDHYGVLSSLRTHWGYSPAVDQQVGGLIMWVPACLVYLGAIMGQFARWYGSGAAAARARASS